MAIVVLAVGLLGLAGLQLLGLRGNTDSYVRSQVAILANELSERMHINYDGADRFNAYSNIDIPATEDCSAPPNCGPTAGVPCTATQVAVYDACEVFTEAQGLFRVTSVLVQCVDNDGADADACSEGSPHDVTMGWTEVGPRGNDVAQTVVVRFQP
jgi:type IV pilus assembly protein PilV